MEFMGLLALLGAAVLAAVILTATFLLFVVPALDERPLLLGEMAERQHGAAGLRAQALAAERPEFAIAARACVSCSRLAHCRTWLDSGGREGYDAFCPNHGFIARLRVLAG